MRLALLASSMAKQGSVGTRENLQPVHCDIVVTEKQMADLFKRDAFHTGATVRVIAS